MKKIRITIFSISLFLLSFILVGCISDISNAINYAPIAQVIDSKHIKTGTDVLLDGSLSTDKNGDKLIYHWAVVEQPENASVVFSSNDSENSEKVFFKPTVEGKYVISLTVSDGKITSTPAFMTILVDENGIVENFDKDEILNNTTETTTQDSSDSTTDNSNETNDIDSNEDNTTTDSNNNDDNNNIVISDNTTIDENAPLVYIANSEDLLSGVKSGVIDIKWVATSLTNEKLKISIIVTNLDNEQESYTILSNAENSGFYKWDSNIHFPNSSFLRVKITIIATDINGLKGSSSEIIRVNNVNHSIKILEPQDYLEGYVSGRFNIKWQTEDPDNDPLTIDIYIAQYNKPNDEKLIVSNEPDNGTFVFDSYTLFPNAYHEYFILRIVAKDDRGNEVYAKRYIKINNVNHLVLITPFTNDITNTEEYLTGLVTIKYKIVDPDGDNFKVSAYIAPFSEKENKKTIVSNYSYSGTINFDSTYFYPKADNEIYVITVVATDQYGNSVEDEQKVRIKNLFNSEENN